MGWEERDYHRSGSGSGGGGIPSILRFLNLSFPIGTYFNIGVRVHILFILLVVVELLMSIGSVGGPWWALRWTCLLFVTVLAHEFGHVAGCRSVGGTANEILMWPLGGLAFCAAPQRPWPEFVTVACGPLVNVVVGAACYVTLMLTPGVVPVSLNPFEMWGEYATGWRGLVGDLFVVNYIILLFNLVMVFYPFDGGRLVQVGLWTLLGYQRSMTIATRVGMGGAVLVAVVGLMNRNFMLMMVAVFGFYTCYQQARLLQFAGTDLYNAGNRGGQFGYADSTLGQRARKSSGKWQKELERRRREDEEVDRILAKVRAEGLASLTRKEKKTLKQATERQREAG